MSPQESADATGIFLTKLFATIAVGLTYGDGDNPRMTLHPTLVALVDAELEGVVARRLPRGVRETRIPGFDGRGIDGGASDACLQQDGVDIRLLVLVENADELIIRLGNERFR